MRYPVRPGYNGYGAYSTSQTDVFSFTRNPAAVANSFHISAGVTGEQRYLIPGNYLYAAAVVFPTIQGNVGVTTNYFGSKNYNETNLGMAYGRRLGKMFDVGIQFNYFSYRIPGYGTAGALTGQLGVLAHLGIVTAGIQVYNPAGGTLGKIGNEKIGSTYSAGIGYQPSETFGASVELIREENFPLFLQASFQYQFEKRFYLRGGFTSDTDSPFGGAGISWKQIRFDLFALFHPQLGLTPGVQVMFDLKGEDDE